MVTISPRLHAAALFFLTLVLLTCTAASAQTAVGTKKAIGVRVLFSDASDAPTQSEIAERLNSAKFYFGRWSYGKLDLKTEVTTVNFDRTRGSFSGSFSGLASAVRTKLTAAGFDVSSYRNIGLYPGGGGFGSVSAVGGVNFVASGAGGATLHEMGHNFGFGHQKYWKQTGGALGPLDSTHGSFTNNDPFHFMSGTSTIAPSGTDPEPFEKWDLDWITDRHLVNTNGTTDHRVYTFDQKDTDSGNSKRTLTVKRGDGQDGEVWAGYRSRLLRDNELLQQGLSLYWRPSGSGSSALVDAHPWTGDGPGGLSNHAIQPGETWSDGQGQIHITNLGRGGTAPNEYLDVRVKRGAFAANLAPVPTWDAPATWVANTPLTISVDGNDPNGDEVSGMWGNSALDIPYNNSSTENVFLWDEPGTYNVSVMVSDMKGETVRLNRSIVIAAAPELACDFDGDGDCEQNDIDGMYTAFGSAGRFDFDASGTVDADDISGWLASASTTANSANPAGHTYTLGDSNLDGSTSSSDLGILLNNFGSQTMLSWRNGNLNGDGAVNSADLGRLLNEFGFTSAAANAVPEPNSSALLLPWFGLTCLALRSRQRRQRRQRPQKR